MRAKMLWMRMASRLKQQHMFQTLRSLGILPSEFEKRSRPSMSQRKWHFQKQIGTFASARLPVCYPICITENLPNGIFHRVVFEDAGASPFPLQRKTLICMSCHVPNQMTQDNPCLFSRLQRESGQIPDHVLTLWQITREVEKNTHTWPENWSVMCREFFAAVQSGHSLHNIDPGKPAAEVSQT